jgi:hypothetical protein
MSETAEKSDPILWDKVKAEVTAGSKGGKKGQWSARKAQLAVHLYQERGGGYVGAKDDAHNSLHQWTKEKWDTKSGRKSEDTGERYLPEKDREKLTDAEYRRTSDKKRRDTARGRQFSSQPDDLKKKLQGDRTKAELYAEAKKRQIAGRSTMTKAQLERALAKD